MAKFPAFSLPGSDGATWSLKALAGTPFVLYFYPKDMTPGCTTESCNFRDLQPDFTKLGVKVFGISPDSLDSHAKFIAKENLNFVLLADTEKELALKLNVWVEKTNYGKTYMGIERSTFLVGADGALVREWRKVKVDGHVDEVAAAVKELVAAKAAAKK